MRKTSLAAACALTLAAACSSNGGGNSTAKLASAADSMAYIIGMNVGLNLLHMDSTLHPEAVAAGVRDVLRGEPRLSLDEARTYYLRQITFEEPARIRAYEEEFLEEIRQSNRSYARTKSGLTYTIEEIGNEKLTPTNSRDTVFLRYVLRDASGTQLYSSYDRGDTLRSAAGDLLPGVEESLRLIGEGGKMEAWVPSAEAYGTIGDKTLGVAPNATLFFELELVGVEKYNARRGGGR